jgi:hypothetical protein
LHLSNIGTGVLSIDDVLPTCGCTVVELDKHALRHGESADLQVSFNATGYSQSIEKEIVLCTNDKITPRLMVPVRSYVRIGTRLDVAAVSLGAGRVGEKIVGAVTVSRDPGGGAQPIVLHGEADGILARLGGWKERGEVETNRIDLSLVVADQPPGLYSRAMLVDVGTSAVLPLRLSYEVLPVVQCAPASLRFAPRDADRREIVVKCRWAKGKPHFLEIASLYGKVTAVLREQGVTEEVVVVKPVWDAVTAAGDFDILEVKYDAGGRGGQQVVDVPVAFGASQ